MYFLLNLQMTRSWRHHSALLFHAFVCVVLAVCFVVVVAVMMVAVVVVMMEVVVALLVVVDQRH